MEIIFLGGKITEKLFRSHTNCSFGTKRTNFLTFPCLIVLYKNLFNKNLSNFLNIKRTKCVLIKNKSSLETNDKTSLTSVKL